MKTYRIFRTQPAPGSRRTIYFRSLQAAEAAADRYALADRATVRLEKVDPAGRIKLMHKALGGAA